MAVSYIPLFFVACAALWLLYYAWLSICKARAIEDTPTSKIRSAPQGYVELVGETKADQPVLRAPLTGEPCLWWRYQIERLERSGRHRIWRTIRRGRSDFSFLLDDGSGQCHIHPEGADIRTRHRQVWYGHSEVPPRPVGTAGSGVFFSGGRYRFTEQRIQEGDLLYALGLFQTIYPPPASVQKENRMVDILTEWKSDYDELLKRFDTDGDGQISLLEWERARQEAAAKAHQYVLDNPDHDPVHMLCGSPIHRQHFILANKDPKLLAGKYRLRGWGSALLFIGAVALIFHLVAGFSGQ